MPTASLAYQILFASAPPPTPRQLAFLEPADLKKAYRRRALELHPDRAELSELTPEEMTARFSEVQEAHTVLKSYLRSRAPFDRADLQRAGVRPPPLRQKRRATAGWHRGAMPSRRVPFGEYLYFAGKISRSMLEDAVAWQRRQRPSMGRLARDWGLLTQAVVDDLEKRRRPGERFGDVAVRLGVLTPELREALVGMQRRAQRPIGGYFVAAGTLTAQDIDHLLEAHWRHNAATSRRVA